MNLKNACVEVCDSRSMHVWWTALWWSWSTILFIDCLPYEWRSGTSDGLFLPIYPPRSMRVVLWFLMTSKFLQQVYEFFWLMLSPWTIHTLSPFHHCEPLLYHATFAGTIHPPYTFLKTATIPTYHGISIAIPRYIAMQLSTVPFIWHTLLLSYCSLHDHVVDIVFVARPPS